jgi:hypothetical protein
MDKGFSSHGLEAFHGAEMLCAACCAAQQSRVDAMLRNSYVRGTCCVKMGRCEDAGAAHLPTMQHLLHEFALPSVPGCRYLVLGRAVVKVK